MTEDADALAGWLTASGHELQARVYYAEGRLDEAVAAARDEIRRGGSPAAQKTRPLPLHPARGKKPFRTTMKKPEAKFGTRE